MRASRLLSILTTLDGRGRATAGELAAACEVSLRTIYRDIEALSAAGIPVYSERGADGGYRLLDGYRTKLNGLSEKEVETLFTFGLSGPAAELGLGDAMATAHSKLLSAIPPHLRSGAAQMQARFHLDAPDWFAAAEQPLHLTELAVVVWQQQSIRIRYRSWKAEVERCVEPLGLVLKSGAWYLVGRTDGDPRTYRISRILVLTVLEQHFDRPDNFDLVDYWRAATQRLEADLHQNRASIRLSPQGLKLFEVVMSPYVRAAMHLDERADADGWRVVSIPVGSMRQACFELLRFGAEIEVLGPPELRTKMTEMVADLNRVYGGAPVKTQEPGCN